MSIKTHIKRKFRGSAYLFASNTSSISSGDAVKIVLDLRFEPYDDVLIVNLNSDNDATVKVNYSISQPLPRGNKVKINIPVEFIQITNDGATSISANEIKIFYRNTGFQGEEIINKGRTGLEILGNLSLIKNIGRFFR